MLPAIAPLGAATQHAPGLAQRAGVRHGAGEHRRHGNIVLDCANGEPFAPVEADLGTLNPDGTGNPLGWDEPITENPALGAIEVWEIYNFTADAHPIHIHEVTFEVVDRQAIGRRRRGPRRAGRPVARTRSSPTRTRSRG